MTTQNSTISMAYTPSASFLNGSYLQDSHQLYNDSIHSTVSNKSLPTAFPFHPMMLIAELGGGGACGGDDFYAASTVAATNDERLSVLLSCQQQHHQQQQRLAHEHQKQPMASGNCSAPFGNYQQPTTSSTASNMFYQYPGHGNQLLFEQSNGANNNNDRHPFCATATQQQSHYDFGGIGPPPPYDHYAGWLSVLPPTAPPISTITITTTTTISTEKSINHRGANQNSTRNDSDRSAFPEQLCNDNNPTLTAEGRLLGTSNNNGNVYYRQQRNMEENIQRNNNTQSHITNVTASDEIKRCSDSSAMTATVTMSMMRDSQAPPPLDVLDNHPMTSSNYFGAATNFDYVADGLAYSIPYNWGQATALSADQLLYSSLHREENDKVNYISAYNENKIPKNSSTFSTAHKNESVKPAQSNALNFNYSDKPLTDESAERRALKKKPGQTNSTMIDAKSEHHFCDASNGVAKSRVNINGKMWTCTTCGKKYCSRNTLKTHLKQHHVEQKQFICQVCGKSFSQAANLTAHKRVHTGEKPFQCCICYRPFSQSSSLVTHKRTHTGERPYPCAHCHKAFTDSSTLTKHLRTHTGQKPYSCRLCLMQFSQSGNLHRHMKTHTVASNIMSQRSIVGFE